MKRSSISIADWPGRYASNGDAKADEQAATRMPARLLSFIESGAAGLEEAHRVIDQFAEIAPSDDRGEPKVVYKPVR